MNEYGAFSKEVSELLSINANTLRRWSIELEKQGYMFERNNKDQRIYYKRDVMSLRQLQHLIGERVSMLDACMKVASEHINKKELEQTLSIHEKESVRITLSKEELEDIIESSVKKSLERQEQFNKGLVERLEQQQKYIDESLKRRDDLLLQSIRETQETHRLIESTKTPEKKWWEFWKR